MKLKESEKIELKSSFSEWKEAIIALCAFANKKGGKVIVGMKDDGTTNEIQVGKNTIEECEKNGNKLPDFSEKTGAFVVSFKKRETKDLEKDLENLGLSENQKKILSEINKNKAITQRELSLKIGINEKNVRNNITELKEKELLERVGSDKGGYWKIIKK
ncbi:MAG: RNA-binding domain-containing protein [Parcubacteria group bacterium]|jgi:predicted HTH transcriptional regulator